MTSKELLRDIAARGVILSANGDRLRIDAPEGVLTTELKAELSRHKRALLARLSVSEDPKNHPTVTPADSREWIEERSAIMEADGGLTSEDADCKAFMAWFDTFIGWQP